ncbi:MAG: hypothetical protein GY719_01460 [bacterium]|nr:hypothetical protein [bacterium]
MTGGPPSAVVALLELVGTEHPALLRPQLAAISGSSWHPELVELARRFGVQPGEMEEVIRKACWDLDRLEKRRTPWRDPAKVLPTPNIAALVQVCAARFERVPLMTRQRRLATILRRLRRAEGLARSRAWIEDFIGTPATERPAEAR